MAACFVAAACQSARSEDAPAQPLISTASAISLESPLTLEKAQEVAWDNHGSILTAREGVTAAGERVRQARTGTLPSVNAEVSYGVSGSGGRSGGGFSGGAQSDTGIQPRVSLDYTIYDGGLTRAAVRQARANVTGSEASLQSARNNLAFSVSRSFFDQLRAERLLSLREEQEKLAEEQLKSVDAMIDAGSAAKADRALQESELRRVQVDRIQAENDIAIAANALRNVMGLPAGEPMQLKEPADTAQKDTKLEELIQTALGQRPEVVQARARVTSAEASVDVARISRRPRVDTTLGASYTPENDSERTGWDAAASVSMPVFDFGLSRSRQKEAEADARSAVEDLRQAEKDVTADVTEAYNNLLSARARVSASRLARDAAKVNLDQETERYRLGATGSSVLSVFTAQVQYAAAGNTLIDAEYDRMTAGAQLERALGVTK